MNELWQMGEPPSTLTLSTTWAMRVCQGQGELGETGLYIYDHLGNNAMASLMARMEYMAVSLVWM